MGSNSKEARLNQQIYWKSKLDERMSILNAQSLDSGKIAKDSAVRKIRAEIRRAGSRLEVVENLGKKVQDMAEAKVKKASEGKARKASKTKEPQEASGMSKRKQKKKAKKEEKQQKTEAEE